MASELLSPTLAAAAAVFVAAGAVKGVVGLGLPTVAMALLALLVAPAHAAVLLIVPSLVTNVWQAGPWRTLSPLLPRLLVLQVGVCLGTWAGLAWWSAPGGATSQLALGAVLVAYGVWGFAARPWRLGESDARRLAAPAGVATGLVTAATGVFVVPAVPWLQALGLSRDELVQAMGLSFSVSTVALAIGLGLTTPVGWADAAASALMLPPALAGMAIGQRLRRRLSPQAFRTGLFAALVVLGLHLLWQAAWLV